MGTINYGRVILGGLLAGVVVNAGEFLLNGVIVADQMEAAMEGMDIERSAGAMVQYVTTSFVLGIAGVWIYAAIRPRFGPGPKTAVCAGLVVWFLVWGSSLSLNLMMGLYPTNIALLSLGWGFVLMPLATTAGAWLYRES